MKVGSVLPIYANEGDWISSSWLACMKGTRLAPALYYGEAILFVHG
jgi:hypothetical protein